MTRVGVALATWLMALGLCPQAARARVTSNTHVPPDATPGAPPRSIVSNADDYEDVVAVVGREGADCTGLVVAARLVVTAGHCLPAQHVVFGVEANGTSVRAISESVRNPAGLDVAALVLAEPAPELRFHAHRSAADVQPPTGVLRFVGFGSTDSTGRRGFGRKHRVDVLSIGWGCDAHRAAWALCDESNEMLITAFNGRDTCDGDSGGPVFEYTSGAWQAVAITSRAVASSRYRCGDGGIYVRLDRVADWISSVETLRAEPSP